MRNSRLAARKRLLGKPQFGGELGTEFLIVKFKLPMKHELGDGAERVDSLAWKSIDELVQRLFIFRYVCCCVCH